MLSQDRVFKKALESIWEISANRTILHGRESDSSEEGPIRSHMPDIHDQEPHPPYIGIPTYLNAPLALTAAELKTMAADVAIIGAPVEMVVQGPDSGLVLSARLATSEAPVMICTIWDWASTPCRF